MKHLVNIIKKLIKENNIDKLKNFFDKKELLNLDKNDIVTIMLFSFIGNHVNSLIYLENKFKNNYNETKLMFTILLICCMKGHRFIDFFKILHDAFLTIESEESNKLLCALAIIIACEYGDLELLNIY